VQGLRGRSGLCSNAVSFCDYMVSLVEMRMECWWNDADRVKLMCLEKKLNHFYFVNLKSPMG
jgi:hypothetical protein